MPAWLSRWSDISWRALVIAAALVGVGFVISRIEIVVIPVLISIFLTTILRPPVELLKRHGLPPLLATWVVFLIIVAIVGAIIAGLVPSIRSEFGSLGHQLNHGLNRVEHWLETGPLHLSRRQVQNDVNSLKRQFTSNHSALISGAVSGLTIAAEVFAAVLLSAFLTFFFVKDGDSMAAWFAGLFNEPRRSTLMELGRRMWRTVTGYVHGTALNGAVNALVLSIGLLILGVPLVPVVALLTFIGGFLPIVGAIISGLVAALVALVAKGPVAAAVVVGLTILVHNLEGYIVGPLVLGRAVKMHPVVVLLALTVGGGVGGILGAFVAVPTAAVLLTVNEFYRARRVAGVAGTDVAARADVGVAAGEPGEGRAPSGARSGAATCESVAADGAEQVSERASDAVAEQPRLVHGPGVDVDPHEET